MIRLYLCLIGFFFGLSAGVQVPGFIEHYRVGLETAELEVREWLERIEPGDDPVGLEGSWRSLMTYYADSSDPEWQQIRQDLPEQLERKALLETELQGLQGPWYRQAWFVLTGANMRLLEQIGSGYDFKVRLSLAAVLWGLGTGLLLAFGIRALLRLLFPALVPVSAPPTGRQVGATRKPASLNPRPAGSAQRPR